MTSPPQPNPEPLRLLFVKLKHIGDALLLTPTLVATRAQYPNAEIWVVVRQGTEGILAGCPVIDRLITVAPNENDQRGLGSLWRDLCTLLRLRSQRFDYAFELTDGDRSRWLAGLSRARHRCANAHDRSLDGWWRRRFNRMADIPRGEGHRVEKDFNLVTEFLPLGEAIPLLSFERAQANTPSFADELSDFVVIHPGTRWIKKRWLKTYWLDLGARLLQRTRHIIISSGPEPKERAFARELEEAWGASQATSTDGQLDWAKLAGLLYRARAFVGVDTAAMHLAAACQCPTVAIFAYSVVDHWRPWKVPHEILHLADQLPPRGKGQRPATEVMEKLTPMQVMEAVERQIRSVPTKD
jgi:heptosyltransferase-3